MSTLNVTMDDDFDGVKTPPAAESTAEDRGDELDSGTDSPEEADSEQEEEETAEAEESSDEESAGEDSDEESDESTEADSSSNIRIPKYRFDQVNNMRKELAKKLSRAEERIKALTEAVQGTDFDFDAKEQQYIDALTEGDTDKAKALRTEIRAAERAAFETESAVKATLMAEQAAQRGIVDDFVETIESMYPQLDKTSSVFDEAAYKEATLRVRMFAELGHNPIDAIAKASEEMAQSRGWKANVAGAGKPGKAPADSVRQPPRTEPVGRRSERAINVTRMSDAEFAKIPDRALRKMRGDII